MPKGFNNLCNGLQTRFDLSDKVRGTGTIIVGHVVPDTVTNVAGIWFEDSVRLRKMQYNLELYR